MARNYQLTINNIEKYEEIKEYVLGFEPNYFYSCIEENKRGSLHMHIYVQYTKCIRLSTKKTCGAHIEVCKGTPQQNKDYIDKIKRAYNTNNVIDELGAIRLGGIKSNLAISLMEKELGEVQTNEFKTWKEIKTLKQYTAKDLYKPNTKVIYIYGESGIGKSRAVSIMLGDENVEQIKHTSSGYWLGVNPYLPTKNAWYDDFRDSQMPAIEFINLTDYNKHQMNVKFCPGFLNQYEKIYITSIQSPYEIYRNIPEAKKQWIRRMTIIHMEEDRTTITRPTDD